jgi:hypothetical protein
MPGSAIAWTSPIGSLDTTLNEKLFLHRVRIGTAVSIYSLPVHESTRERIPRGLLRGKRA